MHMKFITVTNKHTQTISPLSLTKPSPDVTSNHPPLPENFPARHFFTPNRRSAYFSPFLSLLTLDTAPNTSTAVASPPQSRHRHPCSVSLSVCPVRKPLLPRRNLSWRHRNLLLFELVSNLVIKLFV